MEYLGGRTVPDAIPYHGQCTHTGKVFGVGVFKTGTTSLSADLRQLGYIPCGSASGWVSALPALYRQISSNHVPARAPPVRSKLAAQLLPHCAGPTLTLTLSLIPQIGIGHKELFYQNFDGPSLRKSIQASPVLRDFVRALGNATLSATDGPWLFHYQVSENPQPFQ
jgi:hypothetical protein